LFFEALIFEKCAVISATSAPIMSSSWRLCRVARYIFFYQKA
jgi:hypothetical protein